jgi:hypothetical protein
MPRLRVRWATGSDDKPAVGEAIARLARVPGSETAERYPRAGLPAPALRLDKETGEVTFTEPRPTDLVISRHRMELTITASDGRELRAHFGSDKNAPQIDADADDDLRDALIRAWRKRPPLGRPPEQEARIRAIVDAARDLGQGATRDRVAAALGRVDEWGEPHSDYKRDVSDAGGFEEIRRRVRDL